MHDCPIITTVAGEPWRGCSLLAGHAERHDFSVRLYGAYAREEAERRYPARESVDGWTSPAYRHAMSRREGFIAGAEWQASQSSPDWTDTQVEAAAEAFSLTIHQIELVWKHMNEYNRNLYRVAARAALSAASSARTAENTDGSIEA